MFKNSRPPVEASASEMVAELLHGCVVIVAIILVAMCLSAVVIYLGWNFGAVAIFSTLPHITFAQALFVGLLLSIVGSFFRSPSSK